METEPNIALETVPTPLHSMVGTIVLVLVMTLLLLNVIPMNAQFMVALLIGQILRNVLEHVVMVQNFAFETALIQYQSIVVETARDLTRKGYFVIASHVLLMEVTLNGQILATVQNHVEMEQNIEQETAQIPLHNTMARSVLCWGKISKLFLAIVTFVQYMGVLLLGLVTVRVPSRVE